MTFESRPTGVAVTVVDDEPVAQDVLVRAARSWDYQCQSAGTAEQALELLEKKLTPIVVTDLLMPGPWRDRLSALPPGGQSPVTASRGFRLSGDRPLRWRVTRMRTTGEHHPNQPASALT